MPPLPALLAALALVGGGAAPARSVGSVCHRASAPLAARHLPVLLLAKKKKAPRSKAKGSAQSSGEQRGGMAASAVAAPPKDEGEVFPVSASAWQTHRIAAEGASFDALLSAAAAAAASEEALSQFVSANRDMLDYRWLYRLTGELLREQNSGATERSAELRALRNQIVKLNQNFDSPLFKQIAEAERRLGEVLAMYQAQQAPPAAEVVKAAGKSSTEIFAFWVVLCAAIAAWESKLGVPNVVDMAKLKIGELSEVLGALENEPGVMKLARLEELNQLVSLPNQALPAAEPAAARAAFEGMGLESDEQKALIRKLGCISCQCSRHAFQAYSPFVQKTAALYDVLLYGSVQPITTTDINQPLRTEYTSNLVKLAVEAEDMAVTESNPTQLYW